MGDCIGNLVTVRFSKDVCRKALSKMIVLDELPFSFVEREGFRHFCSIACPKFDPPSRTTIVKDINQLCLDEKATLKSKFSFNKQRVCLTTDCWTSIQNTNYMVITTHFIDSGLELHKRILNFCVVPNRKGETIGKIIEACLLDWGIDRVCTISVDNASANDVAIKWNSTYLMLESALKFQKAFERLKEEDGNYVNYFLEDESGKRKIGPPRFDDWETSKVFVKFLKNFYDATLKFSASLSVTSNQYFHEVFSIQSELIELSTNTDPFLGTMATSMKRKYDNSLGAKTVEALICTHNRLRSTSRSIKFESIVEEMKFLEVVESEFLGLTTMEPVTID
ncbi:hypothetical protein Ddye_016004 [Dipteronia dyeriana]|uniref:hAT-like transposase RNase-H fold domain-containing protein n=1 Tax=Dipteronia dyeriana TaxID=168575 RepID=A0AAD9U5Y2_9ROSI|nr:hypothetical protein Ddye_016004 [Dipteronia dyeriana]